MGERRHFDDVIGDRPSWLPSPSLDVWAPTEPANQIGGRQQTVQLSTWSSRMLALSKVDAATSREAPDTPGYLRHILALARKGYLASAAELPNLPRTSIPDPDVHWSMEVMTVVPSVKVPQSAPPSFSVEWFSSLVGFLSETGSPAMSATVLRAWQQAWTTGAVREPHIESFGNEVRFTWNRNGHYLEFSAFADGHVEWFYRSPEKKTASGEGDALDAEFFQHLVFARP